VQARHDGADGHAEHLGDLLVLIALDVGQVDGCAEARRQVLECLHDAGVWYPIQHFGFGRLGGGRLWAPLSRHVGDVAVKGLLGLALLLPVRAGPRVCHDPVQPRAQVGSRRELMEGAISLSHGLLHEILGIAGIARQPQGAGIELSHVRDDITLKPGLTLSGGLGHRGGHLFLLALVNPHLSLNLAGPCPI
jgi:hypothetical protein